MTTANQCEAYAAEYQARGTAPDISIQRATALMSISQSWTTLAGQLDQLAQIIKDEDEEGDEDTQRGLTPVAVPDGSVSDRCRTSRRTQRVRAGTKWIGIQEVNSRMRRSSGQRSPLRQPVKLGRPLRRIF